MKTKNRDKLILMKIVQYFIENGTSVSSSKLKTIYKLPWSTATIRNEMHILQSDNYLENNYLTSGKIPTNKAFKYYAKNNSIMINDETILNKLKDVLSKRWISIEQTIDQATKVIADITKTTLVAFDSNKDEKFISCNLTPISLKMGVLVIVSSKGKVDNKLIEFNDNVSINDVKIAIKIFNTRLSGTKLIDIKNKLSYLKPFLQKSVKNYEQIIQSFANKIFNYNFQNYNMIHGDTNIIKNKQISREKISEIMEMLKTKSIWSSFAANFSDEEDEDQIKIKIANDNLAIFSQKIETKNVSKELSVISSNRVDYALIKKSIKLLIDFIKEKEKNE